MEYSVDKVDFGWNKSYNREYTLAGILKLLAINSTTIN